MKSLRRNKKAVSDVIAVLLMIAIAVAASLIAYAWVMGYLGGTTTKVGNAIQIQSYAKSGSNLSVWVQNVGSGTVTVDSLYVNGALISSGLNMTLLKGTTSTAINATWLPAYNSPATVDIRVVCTDGTPAEATGTVPGQ
jgi:FlaG/FlaF family flagellin (archaellin)